jgi:predicted dehydrogenase
VEILRSGRLGTINQVQAVNNVAYGGVYFGQWYRDYQKAGGLWLQKATHDFDYINCLIAAASPGARPVSITAMHSRTVYGGDLPEDLRCSTCDRTAECPESPTNLQLRGNDGGILNYAVPGPSSDHACAFSESIKNQDAGSAIVMYSDGTHAVYSQNFLTRGSAGRRGVTITGYHATLQFDWQNDSITVIDHHRDQVDRIQVDSQGSHGGGDAALAKNFVDVMRKRAVSNSPLDQGLLSAAMCLSARESAERGITQDISRPGNRLLRSINIHPRGPVEPISADTPTPAPKVATFVPRILKPRPAY